MHRHAPRPLTRNRLVLCILINQLATPGLGSLLAGRLVSGTGQLLTALGGFALILVWMVQFILNLMGSTTGGGESVHPDERLRKWGGILFGASWLWALATSLSLWRWRVKEEPRQGDVPPLIPK